MKISSLINEVRGNYERRQPLMIWGPPGVGKSDAVRQAAKAEGIGLIDLRLSQMDPVDLRGVPVPRDSGTEWVTPSILPREGAGILFLDELPDSPPSMQGAAAQLILDRRLGEYILPEGWSIVAAGNRKEDRASAGRMPTQVGNRFEHVSIDVDHAAWIDWALRNSVASEVMAFVRFRPALLHAFDPKSHEMAFASPRSWSFASSYLLSKHDREVEHERLCGIIGEGIATEFAGFLRIARNLPDPDAVLAAPDAAIVPDDPATLYALCGALVSRVNGKNTANLIKFAERLTGEFSVMLVNDARLSRPEVAKTQAFAQWAVQHQGIFC